MLEKYNYSLVDKDVRACTDVTKFRSNIVRAIKKVSPNAQNIKVVADGYSYESEKLSSGELRVLGRYISMSCKELKDKAVISIASSSKNQDSHRIFIRTT